MEKLIEVLKEFFKVELDENTKLGDFDKWDSLGHLNLFMKLEEVYNVSFSIDEIMGAKTIKDIHQLLKSKNV